MTCKDFIIYILQNKLENEPFIQNGKLIGFMTIREAAAKFGVGEATVHAWVKLDIIDSFKIGNDVYIFSETKSPLDESIVETTILTELYGFNNTIYEANSSK